MFLKHGIRALYIFFICLNLLATKNDKQKNQDLMGQFFAHKKNNLNQDCWDLTGTDVNGKKFLMIWVPNHAEDASSYFENGIILQSSTSKNKAWIRARLPAEWTVKTKITSYGTYRIIKDRNGCKKLGIYHYLSVENTSGPSPEAHVLFFSKGKVKKKVN